MPDADSDSGAGEHAEVGPEPAVCTLEEVARSHLRLADGTYAYVEPQALLPAPGGFLLAGQPTYTSSVNETGRGSLVDERTFFGVRVTAEGGVIPVPQPAGVARIEWVRGTAVDGSRWDFVFDEVAPDAEVIADPERVVFGALDGTGEWLDVETLPTPPTGVLESASTATIRSGPGNTRISIVAAEETGRRDVLRYRRTEAGWRTDLLWPRWVDQALLHHAEGRPRLVLTGLAPELRARSRGVRVVTLPADAAPDMGPGDAPPVSTRHRVVSPEVHFRDARAAGDARLDVGWLEAGPDAPTSAWLVRGATRPGAAVEPLASAAVQLSAAALSDSATVWITHEPEPMGSAETSSLGFTVALPSGTVRAGRIPNPFHGPYAALLAAPDSLWVVGPDATFGAVGSFVRSLVLRLALSCT